MLAFGTCWVLLFVQKVPVMIIAIFVLYGFCDEHRTTMIREVLVDK